MASKLFNTHNTKSEKVGNKAGHRTKVYVGLSGGVDSAVSAMLLCRGGYDVTGVFIKTWQPDYVECTWRSDRHDAMRVAAQLGIKFLTLDLEKSYKEDVIDYMLSEFKNGVTPNPDIMCNRYIKFGGFWDFAKSKGADYIATGHYAKILKTKDSMSNLTKSEMFVASDSSKDQSYFLYRLNSQEMQHIIFPLGDKLKSEVRRLALVNNLWVSNKKDSQGICMLGDLNIKDFLKHEINVSPGVVLDEEAKVIGEHDGAVLYTIGERHGFKIYNNKTSSSAMYVVDKDVANNTITVSSQMDVNRDRGAQNQSTLVIRIKDESWILSAPNIGTEYSARGRYRAELATVKCISSTEFEVVSGVIIRVPGQSLVIYDGNKCIGGGIII